ncbi:unnamed protein product, partial [Polarella glacialis]
GALRGTVLRPTGSVGGVGAAPPSYFVSRPTVPCPAPGRAVIGSQATYAMGQNAAVYGVEHSLLRPSPHQAQQSLPTRNGYVQPRDLVREVLGQRAAAVPCAVPARVPATQHALAQAPASLAPSAKADVILCIGDSLTAGRKGNPEE